MATSRDYLIVSDLHLRGGYQHSTEGLYHFDEEFADFLRYYRLNRTAPRPWTLIIGGDFIEFRYITDLPDRTDPLLGATTFSKSEQRYGPGTEAEKSRWKLDRILRSCHPQLLLSLARFIAEGNSIVLLRGNHDAEMFWPEVQEHFRRLIAEHHPEDVSYMAMKQAVAERVQFAPWFWYVPGVLYAEHGCQYDPFCSFEYFLYPVVPARPTCIENSISDLSIRYFANEFTALDAMAVENVKSTSEYVGWVLRKDLAIVPRAFRLYAAMVRRIIAKSGPPDPQAEGAVRAEHERRVAATDECFALPPGTTAAVQAMHATPVMRRVLPTARFLGVDLLAFAVLILASVVFVLTAYPGRTVLLVVVAAAAAAGVLVHIGALRIRRIWGYGHLRRVAERIAGRFGVVYVILGHSHQAGTWPLGNGATYFNVGTWVPLATNAYFVYLVLSGEGTERTAGLWRWNKATQQPEPFESGR